MRIGLLSFAHVHAATYASLLRDRRGTELLCADPDGAAAPAGEVRGRALAHRLHVQYADSYDDLFAWGPDAVIVCSENARHRDLVVRAAAEGAHVLCEKPLATTIADGEAMIAACRDAGVFLMTAYPVRFSPQFRALQAVATNGALLDGEQAGTVRAVSNRILHADKPQVRAETGGLVSITYPGGLRATIDCSWSQPDHAETWGGLTLDVIGTEAAISIDPFARHVSGFTETTRGGVWLGYGTDLDREMLDAFLDGVRTGVAPQPDGEVGLRTLRVVVAAQQSAATGRVVAL